MEQKEYKTSEHIVAYIAIPDSKEMIYSYPNTLQIVHEVYDKALRNFEVKLNIQENNVQTRIFFDNIVLYLKTDNNNTVNFNEFHIALFAAYIQREFMIKGILVRGGIVKGEFFADETMVWGEALIKAYEIESNVAIYPRIVVSKEAIPSYYMGIDRNYFRTDKDGMTYVNFLETTNINLFKDFVEKTDEEIAKAKDLRVMQKWCWFNNYLHEKGSE